MELGWGRLGSYDNHRVSSWQSAIPAQKRSATRVSSTCQEAPGCSLKFALIISYSTVIAKYLSVYVFSSDEVRWKCISSANRSQKEYNSAFCRVSLVTWSKGNCGYLCVLYARTFVQKNIIKICKNKYIKWVVPIAFRPACTVLIVQIYQLSSICVTTLILAWKKIKINFACHFSFKTKIYIFITLRVLSILAKYFLCTWKYNYLNS